MPMHKSGRWKSGHPSKASRSTPVLRLLPARCRPGSRCPGPPRLAGLDPRGRSAEAGTRPPPPTPRPGGAGRRARRQGGPGGAGGCRGAGPGPGGSQAEGSAGPVAVAGPPAVRARHRAAGKGKTPSEVKSPLSPHRHPSSPFFISPPACVISEMSCHACRVKLVLLMPTEAA